MKTNQALLMFVLALLICSYSCNQTMVKSETVLQLMKSLFSKGSNAKSAAIAKQNEYNDHADLKRSLRKSNNKLKLGTNEASKLINSIDKSQLISELEKLAVVNQDWIKISTPEFKNPEKYPPTFLNDNTVRNIKLNSKNLRINETFKRGGTDPNLPPQEDDFWFRVSDKNIYYTNNKNSIHVLGSLPLKSIIDVQNENKADSSCFKIFDLNNSQWKLCPSSISIRKVWVCYIRSVIKMDSDECKTNLPLEEPIIQTTTVTEPIILIPLPSKECNDAWNYGLLGDDWECDCKEGKTQSPIDIDTDSLVRSNVKPIFKYESNTNLKTQEEPKQMVYENGSVKLKYDQLGKVITLDGAVYKASEIIFHTPAQHKINGKTYPLEVEIIHSGLSKEVIAQNLVLSILFELKPGVYNKFFDDIDYFNLPNPVNKAVDITEKLNLNKILYDSSDDTYPKWKDFSIYTYEGSLTAPPCTERTIYYVKADPIPLGNATLQLMKEALKVPDTVDALGNIVLNTAQPNNARKTQPLNGRKVFYYEFIEDLSTTPKNKISKNIDYHYEKISKNMVNYFHVDTEKPSGLPNSFVVSEKEALGYEQ